MADVAIYLLSLANVLEIDLGSAISLKLQLNSSRFPINASKTDTGGTIEVVGLSGSGKSTIGRAVAAKLNLPFVDFADELLHVASAPGDHDSILTWDPATLDERVRDVQRRLAARISSGETIVLETHLCPNVPGDGYRPTHPRVLESRKPLGILLVQTTYDDLAKLRTARGHARDKGHLDELLLKTDAAATLSAAISLASLLGIPCYAAYNRFGSQHESISAFTTIARRWLDHGGRPELKP